LPRPDALAATRRPRLDVLINGDRISGAVYARVVSTNYYSSDHFRIEFAVGGTTEPGLPYWLSAADIELEIRAGFDGTPGTTRLIQGAADAVSVDPVRRSVRVEGRDLSSRLVETSTRESFSNLSAAEIVSLLAIRHGLTPDAVPTADLVGRFFGSGHDQIMLGGYSRLLTEWDLVVYLAQYFGYDAYVEGAVLHFRPKGMEKRTVRLTSVDVSAVRLDRDLRISGSAGALVSSWNAQLGLR
jgi:phage protein D